MYKLIAVGGKKRGAEFVLQEGENVIGRDHSADIHLDLGGISKRHCNLTVVSDNVLLEDLGSANGVFVNGQLTKKKYLKDGDKLALPDVILQVVNVREKKIYIKKKVPKANNKSNDNQWESQEKVPDSLVGKLPFFFRQKIMPIIYGFNEQHEWRFLLLILMLLFIVANVALIISPVLVSSEATLKEEVTLRAVNYAEEVARINNIYLGRGDLDRIDTRFLDDQRGVVSYQLFDKQGRVVRPVGQLNTITTDVFSNEVKQRVTNRDINAIHNRELGDGIFGVGLAIKVFDPNMQEEKAVGYIAIKFRPESLQLMALRHKKAYAEAFVYSSFLGLLLFAFIYYMTVNHIAELRKRIDLCMKGQAKEVDSPYIFSELNPLKNSINNLIHKVRELQDDSDTDFQDIEADDSYLETLKNFMEGAMGPVLILNSQKNIEYLNSDCEELVGLRESLAAGTSLLDSARDQGFAATVIDLCDQSASSGGMSFSDNYDLGGRNYKIHVASLVGKDTFAKAFYVTFVKDE